MMGSIKGMAMKISGGQNSGNQDNLIENGLIKFSLSTQTKVFFSANWKIFIKWNPNSPNKLEKKSFFSMKNSF